MIHLWLILAVIIFMPQNVLSCPHPCACYVNSEVHCTFRSLAAVPSRIPKHVERINLGFNSIHSIGEDSFAGLSKLELLLIHSNDVRNVPNGAFRDLVSLQVFKMSYNKLKAITSHTLHGLLGLTRLHIDHNQIAFIHPNAFNGLTSLRLLHLEGNLLQQLHANTFCTFNFLGYFRQSTLKHLYLSDNMIRSLPADMIKTMPLLENLYLHGNPWICDCNIKWLLDWAEQTDGIMKCKKDRSYENGQLCPACSSPKHLQKWEIQSLKDVSCSRPVIYSALRDNSTYAYTEEENGNDPPVTESYHNLLGKVILNMTDEHGNKVSLDCDMIKPGDFSKIIWSQHHAEEIDINATFSLDFECPMNRENYEKLWKLIAYYSEVPVKLEREVQFSDSPKMTYRYRQNVDHDSYYYTGVKALISSEPSWIMQTSVNIQLNRKMSTAKKVTLSFSTHFSESIHTKGIQYPQNNWVLIEKNEKLKTSCTAVKGTICQLNCHVKSSETPSIEWSLPDGTILKAPYNSPGSRFSISPSGQLVIKEVDFPDSGLYYCIARVKHEVDMQLFRVTVQSPSSDVAESHIHVLTKNVGDPIALACNVVGNPDADVNWILPSNKIIDASVNNTGLYFLNNGSLAIMNMKPSDGGLYRCIAVNQHGTDHYSVQVEINRKVPYQIIKTKKQPSFKVPTKPKYNIIDDDGGSGEKDTQEESVKYNVKNRGHLVKKIGSASTNVHSKQNRKDRRKMKPWKGTERSKGSNIAEGRRKFESRRRINMGNKQIDPKQWANILAKVRGKNLQRTTEIPLTTQATPTSALGHKPTPPSSIAMPPPAEEPEPYVEETSSDEDELLFMTSSPQVTIAQSNVDETSPSNRILTIIKEETDNEKTFKTELSTPNTDLTTIENSKAGSFTYSTNENVILERDEINSNAPTTYIQMIENEYIVDSVTADNYVEEQSNKKTVFASETSLEADSESSTVEMLSVGTDDVKDLSTASDITVSPLLLGVEKSTAIKSGDSYFPNEPSQLPLTAESDRSRTSENLWTENNDILTTINREVQTTPVAEHEQALQTDSMTFISNAITPTPSDDQLNIYALVPSQTFIPLTTDTPVENVIEVSYTKDYAGHIGIISTKISSKSSISQEQRNNIYKAEPTITATRSTEKTKTEHRMRTTTTIPNAIISAMPEKSMMNFIVQGSTFRTNYLTSQAQSTTTTTVRTNGNINLHRRRPNGRRRLRPNRLKLRQNQIVPTVQTVLDRFLQKPFTPPTKRQDISNESIIPTEFKNVYTNTVPSSRPASNAEIFGLPIPTPVTTPQIVKTHKIAEHANANNVFTLHPIVTTNSIQNVQTSTLVRKKDNILTSHIKFPNTMQVTTKASQYARYTTVPYTSSHIPIESSTKMQSESELFPLPVTKEPPKITTTAGTTEHSFQYLDNVQSSPEHPEFIPLITDSSVFTTIKPVETTVRYDTPMPEKKQRKFSATVSSKTERKTVSSTVSSYKGTKESITKPYVRTTQSVHIKFMPFTEKAFIPTAHFHLPTAQATASTRTKDHQIMVPTAPSKVKIAQISTPSSTQNELDQLLHIQYKMLIPQIQGQFKDNYMAISNNSVLYNTKLHQSRIIPNNQNNVNPPVNYGPVRGTKRPPYIATQGPLRYFVTNQPFVMTNKPEITAYTAQGNQEKKTFTPQQVTTKLATTTTTIVPLFRPKPMTPSRFHQGQRTSPYYRPAGNTLNNNGKDLVARIPYQGNPYYLNSRFQYRFNRISAATLKPPITTKLFADGANKKNSYISAAKTTVSSAIFKATVAPLSVMPVTKPPTQKQMQLTTPSHIELTQAPKSSSTVQLNRYFNHINNKPSIVEGSKLTNLNEIQSSVTRRPQGIKPRIATTGLQSLSVPFETNAVIPCETLGDPKPSITWTKVATGAVISKNTRMQRFEVLENGTLSIQKLQLQDHGQYLCTAQNQHGIDKMYVTLTVVVQQPRILGPRYKDVTVYIGDTISMDCPASGLPSAHISWIFPDRKIIRTISATESRIRLHENGTLTIKETTFTDRGIFKCVASNVAGADSLTVRLHIAALPPIIKQEKEENISLPHGNSVYIHCSAKGAPSPNIRWALFDGTQVRTSQFVNGNLFVFPNGTLYIRSLSQKNTGKYECIATNIVGAARRTIMLDVKKYATNAKITASSPQKTDVTYGSTLRLDCSAAGDPWPRILWRLPSKRVVDSFFSFDSRIKTYSNGTLLIYSVTEKDAGDYLCMARNKLGDDYLVLKVNVMMKPAKIQYKNEVDHKVMYGGDLKVDCIATGVPNPEISWTLPDGSMINNIMQSDDGGSRTRRYVVFNNGTLYFNEVGMKEEGHYTCYAVNQIGQDEMRVSVKVVAEKAIIKNKTYSILHVPYGDVVTVSCKAKGEPVPKITWLSPSNRPIPLLSDKYQIYRDGTLLIQKAQRADSGNYTCIAQNTGGEDKKIVWIQVNVLPPTINGFSNHTTTIKQIAMRDSRLMLDCKAEGVPTPRVMWAFPEGVILPAPYYGNRITVHRNGTLDIKVLRKTDSVQLTCIGRNEGGEARLTVHLTVTDPTEKPKFSIEHENIVVSEGQSVSLNCSSHGIPVPERIWFLPNGTEVHNSKQLHRLYHRNDGTLLVGSIAVSDAGTYRCRAINIAGFADKFVTLQIGRKPQMKNNYNNLISIINGETLQLHCSTHGESQPQISWTLPNGVILDGPQTRGRVSLLWNGTLVVRDTSVYDRGSYICKATTQYGSSTMNVPVIVIAYPPRITTSPAPVTYVRPGSSVQLNCMSIGIPKPDITWELPDKSVLTAVAQSRLYRNKFLHPHGTLVIQHSSKRDTGYYKCTAKNILGADTKTTYVHVY
ncbi:matrix-remodeling-associated protein 5 [Xenopus laevis]|uniref:Matrix-remodeling-associated protein 5 n=2 Tax=Xenopus laevis TaxID=8355 RepID=A0A1L8H4R1_XENLA|nr:matrix-remodeling-associated protein 5 [Xenopus laevis]OCT91075.1 hypothetical protein XELAEV_18014129mg [Xenopus laevis]